MAQHSDRSRHDRRIGRLILDRADLSAGKRSRLDARGVVRVWLYLFFQTLFLLVSATQDKPIGISDPIVASFPFLAGSAALAAWLVGRLPLSPFLLNGLAFLLATTVAEFLLTVWIRIVVNRRAVATAAG